MTYFWAFAFLSSYLVQFSFARKFNIVSRFTVLQISIFSFYFFVTFWRTWMRKLITWSSWFMYQPQINLHISEVILLYRTYRLYMIFWCDLREAVVISYCLVSVNLWKPFSYYSDTSRYELSVPKKVRISKVRFVRYDGIQYTIHIQWKC